MTDFDLIDSGSFLVLQPLTESAHDWTDAHLRNEETVTIWGGIAIEHRYIEPIIEAISDEGFTLHSF